MNLAPASPVFATFGDGTPTIPNPNVFSDSILPKVDGATGAFTQRLSLDIPPGRYGLQPDLTLDYSSQRTQDSIVGYGWQLSIPYIARLNKTGSQNLYNANPYFISSIDGELTSAVNYVASATTSPTILDSLPLTEHQMFNISSESRSYTVPSGGSNNLFVAFIASGGTPPTATLNGASLTITKINGTLDRMYYYVGTLANPTSGTFQINLTGTPDTDYLLFTLQNAAQGNPVDAAAVTNNGNQSSKSTSVTTSQGNDLLISFPWWVNTSFSSFGTNENTLLAATNDPNSGQSAASYKAAGTTAGTETMTVNLASAQDVDEPVVAIKAYTGSSTIAGSYVARLDTGSDNVYTFANNIWTVYDKHGTRYLYGSSDNGRQYDTGTGTSTNTYKWYLQEVRDTNGNYVKYTYNQDNNEIYPNQIVYTGNGSTNGPASISFATSTRPDPRISFAPGFKVTNNYRISEIDASFNNKLLRKYLLSYGPGINGRRSLLTSVQQQGYDDNNNLTSLPPTTFTYASSSAQFYTPNGVTSAAYQVGDTNGNGLNDRNEFYYTGCVNGVCTTGLSTYMDSQAYVSNYSPPGFWASSPGNLPNKHGTRYIDVNGDGKPDIVNGWKDYVTPSYSNYSIYLNTYSSSTGIGWTATTSSSSIPTFAINTSGGVLTGGVFGDINGDGLPDYSSSLPGYISPISYFGNGSGWDSAGGLYHPPNDFPVSNPTPYASQLIDVNGDGLDDWVYSDGTNTYVLLNTGSGWETTPEPQWTIPTSTLYYVPGSSPANYRDRGIRFFDINGDGLPDFIQSSNLQDAWGCGVSPYGYKGNIQNILLNTGNGWATSTAYTLPSPILSGYTVSRCSWVGPGASEYGNWNGNGQMLQDVITGVTYPKGGSASIIYASSTQMNNPELPVSLLVAKEIGLYDGMGHVATTTYQYAGGKMYLASGVRDRKFAGFAIATTTAPDSITQTFYSQGVGTNNALGEQADGYAQINRPFRKDTFDLSGNLIQANFYRWDSISHGVNGYFVNLGRQVEQDYASDRTHRDKATDFTYSTSTDDLLTQTEYGEVSGNSDGTFTDIGTDKRTTQISYAASSSVNLSLPAEKTVLNSATSTISDQKLYYDNLPLGQVSSGNNTREEDWISGSTYASSTKSYNSYGLVASSTDRRGNVTSYHYDPFNLYVATTTNPLSQLTGYTYNYSNGKVKETIDPNGRLILNSYDGIGRLIETDQSNVITPSTLEALTTYQYTDNATAPSIVHRSDYLTATNTVDTYDYYDGLNRLVQERKASQTAGTFVATDRIYNSAGLLGSQSLPYFSSGSSYTSPTSIGLLYTSYTYDPLKRVLTGSNAVGTTTNLYAKWTTTTTDPNGNVKDYTLDAFGNLASVVEHTGTLLTTTYSYDAANNLATTTDSAGNVRGFTYDGLARRLSTVWLAFSRQSLIGRSPPLPMRRDARSCGHGGLSGLNKGRRRAALHRFQSYRPKSLRQRPGSLRHHQRRSRIRRLRPGTRRLIH